MRTVHDVILSVRKPTSTSGPGRSALKSVGAAQDLHFALCLSGQVTKTEAISSHYSDSCTGSECSNYPRIKRKPSFYLPAPEKRLR